MSSIATNSKTGTRYIQFYLDSKKRKSLYLGAVTKRQAQTIRGYIDDLVYAYKTSTASKDKTQQWLNELSDDMHDRIAVTGLITLRVRATLGDFTRKHIDSRKIELKQSTVLVFERARNHLIAHFGEDKPIHEISPADADAFWLYMAEKGLAQATMRKMIQRCKQFMSAAKRQGLISDDPFADLKSSATRNTKRMRFIPQKTIEQVIQAAPDAEWRLIIALARYGGLRTPSETLLLRWCDIDWDKGVMKVRSPKTERHEDGESRLIPIFKELYPYLREAFELAETGSVYCITRYRSSNANLRTQFQRIIERAKVKEWPKLFQNLRASRASELAKQYPMHMLVEWMGHTVEVSLKHYMQTTEEDFKAASYLGARQNVDKQNVICSDDSCDALRNVMQSLQELGGSLGNWEETEADEIPSIPLESQKDNPLQKQGVTSMAQVGLEPTLVRF